MYNFLIPVVDTDSITVCKQDGGQFTEEEIYNLTKELNSLFPESIRWEFEFYIPKMIILKAKNYIMFDGEKIKLKGSSIKDQKKEPALKEMLNKIIDGLIYDKNNTLEIYHQYIKECMDVKDISRWCAKKSVSKSILACRGYKEEDILNKKIRRNETVVWDAIEDFRVQEGDKVYLYPAILSSQTEVKELKNGKIKHKIIKKTGLKRNDQWSGNHDVDKLIERIYATLEIFTNVLDMTQFIDYTLIKNKPLLKEIA